MLLLFMHAVPFCPSFCSWRRRRHSFGTFGIHLFQCLWDFLHDSVETKCFHGSFNVTGIHELAVFILKHVKCLLYILLLLLRNCVAYGTGSISLWGCVPHIFITYSLTYYCINEFDQFGEKFTLITKRQGISSRCSLKHHQKANMFWLVWSR